MADNPGTANMIDTASSGVADLASAATSALGQAGPAGQLAGSLAGALQDVWDGYFGSPIPPGDTNWNAYTHQQLYDMLWHNADVGDVGSVAAEWGRHSTELTNQAGALRGQREALWSSWRGIAAAPAADRLAALSERTHDIGARARIVQQAAQNTGDALATARSAMPPPPGDPTGVAVAGAAAGVGVGAAIGAVVGAGAGGVGAGPGAVMGAAIGAVAGGAGSLFLASVAAAAQKAEAVHVMLRYESSLRQASNAVASTPAGATDAATTGLTTTSAAGYVDARSVGGGSLGGYAARGGVPWRQLVGASPLSGAGLQGALSSGAGVPLSELAAQSAVGNGTGPGAGLARRGAEDKEHHNRLPTVDHQLFTVDERAITPVIGA